MPDSTYTDEFPIPGITGNDEFRGRTRIYTDETRIDYKNVISVLTDALIVHNSNREKIQYLLNYEKGIQPILYRKKEIRPEINYRLVENTAAEITDFKVSYEFGSPITYVQRARFEVPDSDPDKDDKRITALNEMLIEESKASKDVELARYFKICGIGYRMIRPKQKVYGRSVFDIITLNPLSTFIVYSNDIYQRPMMAVTYGVQKNGNTLYGCYTDDTYFLIDNGARIINGAKKPLNYSINNPVKLPMEKRHGEALIPKIIPIVEYVNDYDRMGCFEKVMPILDLINIINSDRTNDIAQHVQNLLWVNNATIPEDVIDKLRAYGIIQTQSANGTQAHVGYVESILNQSETQTLVDYLLAKAMKIAAVPTWQENSGGGSTGSAMNLSSGRQDAETAAQTSESIFERSERQAIQIMIEIIKKSDDIPEEFADLTNLHVSDILIRPNRNKIYDLATKANALSTLIGIGIDGKHAIDTVSLFTDPQSVWNDSKDQIKKIQESKTEKKLAVNETQPKANNSGNGKIMQDASDQPQKSAFSNA